MLRVTIEKLVFGGYGLARTDQGVIFVIGAAPGETVQVEPIMKKGGAPIARVVEILEPSPMRRTPPCPVADRCGGCDWLHLTYQAQLEAKKEVLKDCLTRIGRLKALPEIEMVSATEFAYRHRAQIKINKEGKAGFFARNTNDVVPVASCPLLVPALNALLSDLFTGSVAVPPGPASLMVFAGDGEAVASSPLIPGRTTASALLTVGNKRFTVFATSFFQSNRPLLERFSSWPLQQVKEGDLCVDLYGGSGFFSLMLAERFKRIHLIESVPAQVKQAAVNFVHNGCSHLTALQGTAERLSDLSRGISLDCLLVDPPRPGLTRAVRESIARVKPRQLLYVSCNPSTQARDLGFLVNRGGYCVEKIALFDLYPNTHHIESMAMLRIGTC
jgi:23S rRNA (uracil1939-C5)-methyltransferase